MKIAVANAGPDEIAAIVAALESLLRDEPLAERKRSPWRAAGRSFDEGFDALRERRQRGSRAR